jgi:hypothetical protein
MRCVAKTRTGRRCKRRTCVRGDYCYQHLASVKGLEVKKSSLTAAGLGLWAVRAFKKGENIIEYTGEKMSKKQFDKLRPESDYGFLLNQDLVLDARRTTSGVADTATTVGYKTRKRNNVKEPTAGLWWITNRRRSKYERHATSEQGRRCLCLMGRRIGSNERSRESRKN